MSPARMAELERELYEAARATSDAWERERLRAAAGELARALQGPTVAVLYVEPPRMPWES